MLIEKFKYNYYNNINIKFHDKNFKKNISLKMFLLTIFSKISN